MELKSVENIGRELRDSILQLLREYSEALILALMMAIILRTFVFAAYRVSNFSMEPNLLMGDFIIGYRLPFGFTVPFTETRIGHGAPARGDVVVFKCPGHTDLNCMKRVVALPGDRIEIIGQRLNINGQFAQYIKDEAEYSTMLQALGRFATLKESERARANTILVSNKPKNVHYGPFVVPPQSFFALGDNRDFADDSRVWGAISYEDIEAKAILIWFSLEWQKSAFDKYSSTVRWDRVLSRVH